MKKTDKAFPPDVKIVIPKKKLDCLEGLFDPNRDKNAPPKFTHLKLSTWSKHERNNGGFLLEWGAKAKGFGEISLVIQKDGKIKCDSEYMGRDFVLAALKELIRKAKFEFDDAEKAARKKGK